MKRRKHRNESSRRVDDRSIKSFDDDFDYRLSEYDDFDDDEDEEFDLAAWREDLAERSAERNKQRTRDIRRGLYGADRHNGTA